jgi:hypothetical protein
MLDANEITRPLARTFNKLQKVNQAASIIQSSVLAAEDGMCRDNEYTTPVKPQVLILANDVLRSVASYSGETELTGSLAMAGLKYSGELMVVGRAVNGWADGVAASELRDSTRRLRYANDVYESVIGDSPEQCPMLWVTNWWGAVRAGKNYNTRRSAFWRCIQAVVKGLEIADVSGADWPSHLVWSNLYKVAPCKGGNPDEALKRFQFAGCLNLLKWELNQYQPHRLLFLTDANWSGPFLDQLWIRRTQPRGKFVDAAGILKSGSGRARCVVAKHPMTKPESEFVSDILASFRQLEDSE